MRGTETGGVDKAAAAPLDAIFISGGDVIGGEADGATPISSSGEDVMGVGVSEDVTSLLGVGAKTSSCERAGGDDRGEILALRWSLKLSLIGDAGRGVDDWAAAVDEEADVVFGAFGRRVTSWGEPAVGNASPCP